MTRALLGIVCAFFITLLPGLFALNFGQCACSGAGYAFWMFVLVGPAVPVGATLWICTLRLRESGYSRFFILGLLFAIVTGELLSLIIEFWIYPQVRFNMLLSGLIHGPIYDVHIPLSNGMMLSRAALFFLALALLISVTQKTWRHALIRSTPLFIAWLATGYIAQKDSSGRKGHAALQHLMPASKSGDEFTIHFDSNRNSESQIEEIFLETHFHLSELKKFFGPHIPHTDIYVYPSREEKKLWFGGGNTDVTDIHTPSVHLGYSSAPHPTLRHELVHALASKTSFYRIGFHPNLAITEGLAVALAPEPGDLNLHESAAELFYRARVPDPSVLLSPLFWTIPGGRAYPLAGSLIQFIIANYGSRKMLEIYRGKSFAQVLGKPQAQILSEWQAFLRDNFRIEKDNFAAESLFRNPGVLYDLCPHSKSDLRWARSKSVYTRLRQPIGWDPEVDYLPWRIRIDSADKTSKINLMSEQIKKLITSNRKLNPELLRPIYRQISHLLFIPPKTIEDIDLVILRSDLQFAEGKQFASIKTLEDFLNRSEGLDLGEDQRRQISARKLLDESFGEYSEQHPWRFLLSGWRKKLLDREENEPWIVSYLRIRNSNSKDLEMSYLKKQLDSELPGGLDASFYREWFRILAYRFYDKKDLDSAQFALGEAIRFIPKNRRDFYQMELRRFKSMAAP